MRIRDQVSKAIELPIGNWDYDFNRLNIAGKLSLVNVVKILLILCKKIEELEDASYQKRDTAITIQPIKK